MKKTFNNQQGFILWNIILLIVVILPVAVFIFSLFVFTAQKTKTFLANSYLIKSQQQSNALVGATPKRLFTLDIFEPLETLDGFVDASEPLENHHESETLQIAKERSGAAFFHFLMPDIPGDAIIQKATLNLKLLHSPSSENAVFQLYRIKPAFRWYIETEGLHPFDDENMVVTWKGIDRNGNSVIDADERFYESSPLASFIYTGGEDELSSLSLDITNFVKSLQKKGSKNNGLVLFYEGSENMLVPSSEGLNPPKFQIVFTSSAPPPPAPPQEEEEPEEPVTLIDFSKLALNQSDTSAFSISGWNQPLYDESLTDFYTSDSDPTHLGIKMVSGKEKTHFFGISGTEPLEFRRSSGDRIVATFFNSNSSDKTLTARVSFTDFDGPDTLDCDPNKIPTVNCTKLWNTMYSEDPDGFTLKAKSLSRVVFNITDSSSLGAPGALPTEGSHNLVNINFVSSGMAGIVLTKIESAHDADLLAPEAPKNLSAQMIQTSSSGTKSVVELSFDPSTDKGPTSNTTGISRYYVYRDGKLHDVITEDWTEYWHSQGRVKYFDLLTEPGKTYEYAVSAIDMAMTGANKTVVYQNQMKGNESEKVTLSFTTASNYGLSNLVDPESDMVYVGAFNVPTKNSSTAKCNGTTDHWGYAGSGMAYSPDGDPGGTDALGGSLYILGHDHCIWMSEISIPVPLITTNPSNLPRATELQPFTDFWPRNYYYDGSWHFAPNGGGASEGRITYHPGDENGIGEGIHYTIYDNYSSDTAVPSHGMVSLDMKDTAGPWYIGGLPGTDENITYDLTTKLIHAAPKEWAREATGGRDLIVGLGWPVSGRGLPSAGPSFYAVSPGKANPTDSSLAPKDAALSATELLKYGSSDEFDKWQYNWNPETRTEWASFVDRAVLLSGFRALGDHWYGSEDGAETVLTDWDLPLTRAGGTRGWQVMDTIPMFVFYDPADLAKVARGESNSWMPQPYRMMETKNYLFTKDDQNIGDNVRAIAYDPERFLLYTVERNVYDYDAAPVIHVWKIE